MKQLTIGDVNVEVIHKNIKNVHLSVYPPAGRVRIAAPLRMDLDTIRVFAISKLSWIRKQQHKLLKQEREAPREYLTRESHYFFGKRYLLKVITHNAPPKVTLKHSTIELYTRKQSDTAAREATMNEWYRMKLKEIVPELIAKWEKVMNVQVEEFGIRKMKTKWGTCNRNAKRIWLNLELAKKPVSCIEYVVVHEMVHLLEKSHNEIFVAYMTRFLPQWRFLKDELNRLPISHIDWGY